MIKDKETIINWQVEYERPFKGLLKSLGNTIHDNRIYKIYCSGKAVVELSEKFKFVAKIEKDEDGKKKALMTNADLEKVIDYTIRTVGHDFFVHDGVANDVIKQLVEDNLKGIKINDFVLNQVSADMKIDEKNGKTVDKFVVLHDKRKENIREFGFDPFIECNEMPDPPVVPEFDDFDDEDVKEK